MSETMDKVVFRKGVARCPRCHEGTKRMWIGLFPGEPCMVCGTDLVAVDGDVTRKEAFRGKQN